MKASATTTAALKSVTDSEGQFSIHREPPAQGGAAYVRCEGCGAELLCSLGGAAKLVHREGCPTGDA